MSHPRTVRVSCALAGRTRLRVDGTKLDEGVAEDITRVLARLPSVQKVEVQRRTGSVLCFHDESFDPEMAATIVRDALPAPAPAPLPGDVPAAARLSQAMHEAFRSLNADILRQTEGRLDLGLLASLTFVGAGAYQVVRDGKIPAPPWFNLAWWGFRTFMTVEAEAIRRSRAKERP